MFQVCPVVKNLLSILFVEYTCTVIRLQYPKPRATSDHHLHVSPYTVADLDVARENDESWPVN